MGIKNIMSHPLKYVAEKFKALLHCKVQFGFRRIDKLISETHKKKRRQVALIENR